MRSSTPGPPGYGRVMTAAAFASLGLPETLVEGISSLGFTAMTAVQAKALPAILAGEDLLVEAEPGSGKTLAFGLGMLAVTLPYLPPAPAQLRALAVCPTRELAEQVAGEIRKLARRTPNVKVLVLCGGVPFAPQRASLSQGAHVVVGTPGRLEEHLRKGSLSLEQLEVLVLDEADRMLSMGFAPQIESVVRHAPRDRQTLLFSATLPSSIGELSRAYQQSPRRINVPSGGVLGASADAIHAEPLRAELANTAGSALEPDVAAPPGELALDVTSAGEAPSSLVGPLEQRFYRVAVARRVEALAHWLLAELPSSALVFCNTRVECADVARELGRLGWAAAAIHGEMSQRERTHVMRLFAAGSCSVLAATDVAARGWDIGGLAAVVNLGLSPDLSVHRHRVGRTGRAGQPGLAVHFVADDELGILAAIERAHGFTAAFQPLPTVAAAPAAPPPAPMATLLLSAGKNKKLRPGDILGALTAGGAVRGEDVGAITIDDSAAYVAVRAGVAEAAIAQLQAAPVKGRSVKVRRAGLVLREP
jgi:ATP-independent RNA helicase DbpA